MCRTMRTFFKRYCSMLLKMYINFTSVIIEKKKCAIERFDGNLETEKTKTERRRVCSMKRNRE